MRKFAIFTSFVGAVTFTALAGSVAAQGSPSTPPCTCSGLWGSFSWEVQTRCSPWFWWDVYWDGPYELADAGQLLIGDKDFLDGTDSLAGSGYSTRASFKMDKTIARALYQQMCYFRVKITVVRLNNGDVIKSTSSQLIGNRMGDGWFWNFVFHGGDATNHGTGNPSWEGGVEVTAQLCSVSSTGEVLCPQSSSITIR